MLSGNDTVAIHLLNYHETMCPCRKYDYCFKPFGRCIIKQEMFHSLHYGRKKETISYFVQYASDNSDRSCFGQIQVFFQHQSKTYALLSEYEQKYVLSDHMKGSKYYGLVKEPLDNLFLVLDETTTCTVVSVKNIVKHLIVFENLLRTSSILVTPISCVDEHD